MRAKKWLAALLALGLLLGLIPTATMENAKEEIVSEAVEPAVPEAESLGENGLFAGDEPVTLPAATPSPDALPVGVSASASEEYSLVHITKPSADQRFRPGAEVEVWLSFDQPTGDFSEMAQKLSPVTLELVKDNTIIETKKVRADGVVFDEAVCYYKWTISNTGVYEVRASVPGTSMYYSEKRFAVLPEPTATPASANPVGEGEKTVKITSPVDGAQLSAGTIPITVAFVKPSSGKLNRDKVEKLYTPVDVEIYREGAYVEQETAFADDVGDSYKGSWKLYDFNAQLGGTYEIRVCSREFGVWDSVTIHVDGPSYYKTKPASKNPGYHIVPKQTEYTVDLSGDDKTVRVEYRLTSFEEDDDKTIWRKIHLDSEGADCVEYVDGGWLGGDDLEYEYENGTEYWYNDCYDIYAAKKVGTAKLHVYAYVNAGTKDVLYERKEILIHVIDSAAPKRLDDAQVTVKNTVYTGEAAVPAVTVKLDGKKLKKGTDYTVTCKNKAVGPASVTIKGKGRYTGTVKAAFRIVPKSVTGLKLKAGSKQLTATWKKVSGVTGYQVQYGTKADFSNAAKKTVKGAGTLNAALKSLKSNKIYYVRVRAYKTVKGVKYWSAWSDAVRLKTK